MPETRMLCQVVPAREIVARIDAETPLEPLDPNYPVEVARRYRDGSGHVPERPKIEMYQIGG